jgi:A/G-specific adenine glycosylase
LAVLAEKLKLNCFARRVIVWQKRNGRHGLPWQNTTDPYRIWLSEIMLQQTRVAAVIPYYQRFLQRFPDIGTLAAASRDDVLAHWSGLGYYSRARNLHQAAQAVVRGNGGRFPADFDAVFALPGIGRSTAAAICVFAFGARRAILDGNVKRVLARYFGVDGYPGNRRIEDDLWRKAEALLPGTDIPAYTQGLMDLGAEVCTRGKPRCPICPLAADCVARRHDLTRSLPAPRPRKVLPHRATVMLVLQRAGEVLLEKRPANGIWGGLWSLPEISPDEDSAAVSAQRYGARTAPLPALPVVKHGFTHFRLTITPQRLRVTGLAPRAAESGHLWLPLEEARTAAIPAPVRRILAGL